MNEKASLTDEDPVFVRGKTILVFSIDGCDPCTALAQYMREQDWERDQIAVRYIKFVPGDDQIRGLIRRFKVPTYPTVVFLRDGDEVRKFSGFSPGDTLDEHLDWIGFRGTGLNR
ncbi:thioredoxin family protein [Maricaulis sp.]|uniref:thioredoxin family protein n=1 Tax=Maricaulis sp. TaxID=1486257 RepID=UPI00260DFC7E|nr:thioredoxin family protein [Maricaulis sp.]